MHFITKFLFTLLLLVITPTAYADIQKKSLQQKDTFKKCNFGYTPKGAIAMHGLPDVDKTNSELCKLYNYKENANGESQSVLRISEKERFGGLNYLIPKGDVSYSVRGWVIDSLMYRTPFEPFTMYPNIASIDSIDDKRSYVVFKINPLAKFSNNKKITSRDVLFSFEKLKKNGLYNYQIAYQDITAKMIDKTKIRFDFSVQNRELPLILGLMPIFSAKTTDDAFNEQDLTPPIMSSPYRVKHAEIGKTLILTKDPNYWGLSTPQGKARFHFDTVKFDFYQSDIATFESLRAGQSDFFYEDNLKRLHTSYDFPAFKDGEYQLHKISTQRPAAMYAFTLNTRRPMLSDIHLRQAMFLAFNFDAVSNDYLYGEFKQIHSLFAGSDMAFYKNGFTFDKMPKTYRNRLRLAHKILKENGYSFNEGILKTHDNQIVQFHILLNRPVDEKFAGALKNDLEKIGIKLTIQTVDDTLYQHYLSDFNYDIIVYSWGNSLSPGIEQKNYWHCDSKDKSGSRNYAGICNPQIDTAIDMLISTNSRDELVKSVAKLDYELMKNYYFLPLYGQGHYNIIAKKYLIPSVGGATYFAKKIIK